ncbi:hypothetical protein [Pseudaestuariivita sp.]|uniref:hypothetical protein n=1 Tax=Pseudaestuariivita sp. TaxID=2211669 RepID=UPI00405A287B
MSTETFMAMKGAGYYSRATTGARDVILKAKTDVEAALSGLIADGGPITLTDMGAADGGTSLPMWGEVIADLKARLPERDVQLVYTDLPRNDFSQLFQIVQGLTEIESPLAGMPGLSVLASATSFHRQIVAAGTLDLGFSATASHYIAETPCDIPDHVHMVGASGDIRDAYRAKGAKDWEALLLARARELKPGGHLVLYNFGIDGEGRYLGNTGGQNMFDTFDALWREMGASGDLTEDEVRGTNFPQVYRTVEEFTAPFEGGPVVEAGLELVSAKTLVTPCPYAVAFAKGGQSAADFAKAYVPTLRSWSEPTFASGIASRSPTEQARLLDQFYGAYEARVAADPTGHGMDYVHCAIVARKRG